MATADSVKNKLTALLAMANAKTGKTDVNMTDAVTSLIAGFGQAGGGSDGGTSGIYMAKITPASEKKSFTITHNLGTTDILMAVIWAETFGDVTPSVGRITMRTWLKTDIPVRLTSSSTHPNIDIFNSYSLESSHIIAPSQPTSDAYLCKATDENNFFMYGGGSTSAYFYAGVTYTVIIMAASAFKETEE